MVICFDVDGTLIDSNVPMVEALNGALVALGLRRVALHEVKPLLGPPLLVTMDALLSHLGASRSLSVELAKRYRQGYRSLSLRHATTYPGISAALGALHDAGHTLVVVSSKPAAYSVPLLQKAGLHQLFAGIHGPAGREDEPKARTLTRALAIHDENARVLVGDTVADVDAARQVGIPVVAVAWGYGNCSDLAAQQPDAIAHAADQLPDLLTELIGAHGGQ